MRVSYISNIPINVSSGGGSGVNTAIYRKFKKAAAYFNYQNINPEVFQTEQLISRSQKLFKIPRNYYFYSGPRLNKIKALFKNDPTADFNFFHGFTPWIKIRPDKPYFCFNDACFATYVEIYNKSEKFRKSDLKRIFDYEAKWLDNAVKVFFRSQWALEETKKRYNLEGNNFVNVGVGGFINIPLEDTFSGEKNFLSISREFRPKGGPETVKAFQKVLQVYPDIKLFLVGEKPDMEYSEIPGVEYLGFFNKNDPRQKKQLAKIFSKAFALIHPTLKDVNPLVINELAYFGCPAISSNRFAIPEYIQDQKTGLLIEDPRDVNEIAQKMMYLLEDEKRYLHMRKAARLNATTNNTWEMVFNRMIQEINDSI